MKGVHSVALVFTSIQLPSVLSDFSVTNSGYGMYPDPGKDKRRVQLFWIDPDPAPRFAAPCNLDDVSRLSRDSVLHALQEMSRRTATVGSIGMVSIPVRPKITETDRLGAHHVARWGGETAQPSHANTDDVSFQSRSVDGHCVDTECCAESLTAQGASCFVAAHSAF